MSQVASRPVTRPPGKPRKGELFRLHVFLPSEMVEMIDKFAQELDRQREQELREQGIPWTTGVTPTTRTEATKLLLIEGLKKRGLLK